MKNKDEIIAKLLELDPEKEYIMVIKKGTVREPIVLPKNAKYKRFIPIVYVDNLDDIELKEKQIT